MKKLAKVLMVAAPAFVLAACSSSSDNAAANAGANANAAGQFGGMSAQDLQTRYNTVYFGFDSYAVEGEYRQLLDAHLSLIHI